jgi:hypothetical protein
LVNPASIADVTLIDRRNSAEVAVGEAQAYAAKRLSPSLETPSVTETARAHSDRVVVAFHDELAYAIRLAKGWDYLQGFDFDGVGASFAFLGCTINLEQPGRT